MVLCNSLFFSEALPFPVEDIEVIDINVTERVQESFNVDSSGKGADCP